MAGLCYANEVYRDVLFVIVRILAAPVLGIQPFFELREGPIREVTMGRTILLISIGLLLVGCAALGTLYALSKAPNTAFVARKNSTLSVLP